MGTRKLWATLALVMAAAPPSWAATHYVDNSCSQNGNGSATTCGANGPWNNLNLISCASIAAGDVIEIRAGKGYSPSAWYQLCSGTSANPVLIQNYANDNVVFDGTTDIHTSTWTAQGGGVYLCTGGACGGSGGKFPFTAWYQLGTNPEERLDLIQSKSCSPGVGAGCPGNFVCKSTVVTAGKMTFDGQNQRVCVHLSDGSSPAAAASFRTPVNYAAIDMISSGVDYVTLRKNPAGGSFVIQRFRDHGLVFNANNLAVTIDGLDVGWMMDRCINDSGTTTQVNTAHVVQNSTVHHCGQEGIDIRSTTGVGSLIANNSVFNVQTAPIFEACYPNCLAGFTDNGVGIMVGETANVSIRNNVVRDFGGGNVPRGYGIDLENGAVNALVDSNVIYNGVVANTNLNCGHGIMLEGSTAADNYGGTVVRNNRVYNVDNCFTVNAPQVLTTVQTVRFQNNTCVDPTRFGFFDEKGAWQGAATLTLENMLFANLGRTLGQQYLSIPAADTGIFKPVTSLFWCPAPYCSPGATIIVAGSTTYQNTQTSLTGYSSGNIYADPNLVATGSPPSLRISAPSGGAYNAGTALSPAFPDFDGEARPQGGTWDIGADEFSGTQPAPPVLMNVIQVP